MCFKLFKKKKKSVFVVEKRTEDITPFVIPHISVKGSYEENPYKTFVSTIHGEEQASPLVNENKVSNIAIDRYTPFSKDPIYKEDEPFHEFRKVRNTKSSDIEKPVSSLVLKDEETIVKETIEEFKEVVETPIKEEIKEDTYQTFEYHENDREVKNDQTFYKDLFNVEEEKPIEEIKPVYEKPVYNEPIIEEHKEEIKEPVYHEPVQRQLEDENGRTIEELALLRNVHKSPSYDNYVMPSIDLLDEPKIENTENPEWVSQNIEKINTNLQAFNISGYVAEYTVGPTFTRYAIQLAPGVSGNKVENLSLDLQRSLEAITLRIENPIPGKPYVGIEVPNPQRRTVNLKELLNREEYLNPKKPLTFPVGLDVEGKAKYISVLDLPHGLVAGASGSGKSVFLNTLVLSLILKNSPEELRFFIIDPKQVDLQAFSKIPHLLSPIVQDPMMGIESLKWMVEEMNRRFSLFRIAHVPNLKEYKKARENDPSLPNIPYIVMIIDEAGDFLMTGGNEAMSLVTVLIQKCRASGIHMFISTQKPVAKIISTAIKSNASARFALTVASQTDSMVILDEGGAEKLLGNGDMIFSHPEGSGRYQSAYVSNEEVQEVVRYCESQASTDFYFNPFEQERRNHGRPQAYRDDLLPDIARYVVNENRFSMNAISKTFGIGFNRAQDIANALEQMGVIGSNEGTKAREVLVSYDELEEILAAL